MGYTGISLVNLRPKIPAHDAWAVLWENIFLKITLVYSGPDERFPKGDFRFLHFVNANIKTDNMQYG